MQSIFSIQSYTSPAFFMFRYTCVYPIINLAKMIKTLTTDTELLTNDTFWKLFTKKAPLLQTKSYKRGGKINCLSYFCYNSIGSIWLWNTLPNNSNIPKFFNIHTTFLYLSVVPISKIILDIKNIQIKPSISK